jgi:hypothetical protein
MEKSLELVPRKLISLLSLDPKPLCIDEWCGKTRAGVWLGIVLKKPQDKCIAPIRSPGPFISWLLLLNELESYL